jgi:DNA-binding transcriptional MerR regulator
VEKFGIIALYVKKEINGIHVSVGKIARMFGISRTTLLYYDNIGLLSPLERSEAGYRLYNGDDLEKLSRIKLFRDAGIPLNEVSRLLGDKEKNSITAALLKQLSELNRELSLLLIYPRLPMKLTSRVLRVVMIYHFADCSSASAKAFRLGLVRKAGIALFSCGWGLFWEKFGIRSWATDLK